MNKTLERLEWLDAVKGICIILIMLSHYCNIPYIGHYLFAGYVPVFFISSGFTFKTQFNKRTITKRIKRLLIPYFFYGTFFWLILFLLEKQSIINIIGLFYSRYCLFPIETNDNIILLGLNSPLWFLTSLFCATLLTYLFFTIKNKKIKLLLIFTYIITSFFMTQLPILLPWSIDTSFIASLFIILGYYINRSHMFRLFKNKFFSIIVLILLYIILVNYNPNINLSVRQYGDIGIITFGIIGIIEFIIFSLVFQLFEKTQITKILSKIGKSSLRILCIHFPLFILISPYLIGNIYLKSVLIGSFVIMFSIISEKKLAKYNI